MNPAVLVFAALFAVAGYQRARWFQREHGTTPWGWHPAVWGVVMFLSWVIGVILLAIAERQGRNRSSQQPAHSSGYAAQSYSPQAYGQQSYGQPALAGATSSASRFGISEPATVAPVAPVAPAAPASLPAAMWAADPSGRFQYRWWDGNAWTANVCTNGVVGQDPV